MSTAATLSYDQGNVVEITVTFTTTDTGAAVDPASVFFVALKADLSTFIRGQYNNPGGDQGLAVTITKVASGTYRVTFSLDQGGTWNARFYSTGTGQASEQFQISVTGDTLT